MSVSELLEESTEPKENLRRNRENMQTLHF